MTSLALRVNGVSRRVSMVRFAGLLRDLDRAVARLGRDPVLERQSFETDVAVGRLRLELSFKAADLDAAVRRVGLELARRVLHRDRAIRRPGLGPPVRSCDLDTAVDRLHLVE